MDLLSRYSSSKEIFDNNQEDCQEAFDKTKFSYDKYNNNSTIAEIDYTSSTNCNH